MFKELRALLAKRSLTKARSGSMSSLIPGLKTPIRRDCLDHVLGHGDSEDRRERQHNLDNPLGKIEG